MTRIFVYGTLREGMYNYDIYLKGKTSNIQKAYVKGELYQLEGVAYPALLDGDAYITGEIMELQDKELLLALDQMEGFIEDGHIDNEYDRKLMDIYDENEQCIDQLPVYFYNCRKEENRKRLGKRILSNDYVLFVQEGQI